VPYEKDDSILDPVSRALPKPEWAPDGCDYYTGIIEIVDAVPNTTHNIWANGTNDAYANLNPPWLTQPVQFYFIDCYDYETGHMLTPADFTGLPIKMKYALRAPRLETRLDVWTFHQECTELPLFYEVTMRDTGAPVDQGLTAIYTNANPASLIVSVKTEKVRYIGIYHILFTANMILRDGGVIQHSQEFEVEIYNGGYDDDYVEESFGVNTAPYFESPFLT